jgi:hypothetical protein
MRKAYAAIAVTVVLFSGYLFASPYITAYQLKKAIESQDGEALSERIDFPALRQSLKEELTIFLKREMAEETEKDENFATIVAALGGAAIGGMVDAYVTPAGIDDIMKERKANLSANESDGDKNQELSSNEEIKLDSFDESRMSYESFDKFSITSELGESGEKIKFILRRKGLGWALTEIKMSDLMISLLKSNLEQDQPLG